MLGHIFDRANCELQVSGAISDGRDMNPCPDFATVLGNVSLLESIAVILSGEQFRQKPLARIAIRRMGVVVNPQMRQLFFVVTEQSLKCRVALDRATVAIDEDHAE